MQFTIATAGRILFGPGAISRLGSEIAGLGKRILLVLGKRRELRESLIREFSDEGLSTVTLEVSGEPDLAVLADGVSLGRNFNAAVVVGIGGGSVIDTGKAVAALLTNPGDPLDYLEVVGRGQPIQARPAPFIAVPTTAGTGSEVTRNAVLAVPEKQTKVSLRSPMMLARVAVVDPELTYDLPPAITASTGMDALAQVIEPYVSRRANPLVDLYCREGITRAGRSLLVAYRQGADPAAREDMAFTSLMGGLALANAGLGAVHGFAGPVGGMFHAPHGAVCAALLSPVVAVNARALSEREPANPALPRYMEIARLVTGDPVADVTALSRWLDDLRAALQIPRLREYGIRATDLDGLVEKSANASSMKANPLTLTN
ncbi:MAG: iron-containing alcohol dehydrogenase, partial [Chloroflexi bacterium]